MIRYYETDSIIPKGGTPIPGWFNMSLQLLLFFSPVIWVGILGFVWYLREK